MKAIYKIEIDYGRSGSLYGIFVADTERVKKVVEEKTSVYFGEVLGKHSEVEVTFNDPADFILVSDDPAVVEVFEKHEMATGYDPFDYIDDGE